MITKLSTNMSNMTHIIPNRYSVYFVGGYVRDKLLGIESKDIDMVFVINQTDLTNSDLTNSDLTNSDLTISQGFIEMKQFLISNNYKIFLEKPEMLTIRAKFPSDHKWSSMTTDFILAKKEINTETDSTILIGTLEDDLSRRDLTINAIAETIDGKIIDPFGGISDLENRILKTPIDPLITLLDDPLRFFRILRFSMTKQCMIMPELEKAMLNELVIEKLFNPKIISKERIREELTKMFKYNTIQTIRILTEFDTKIPHFMESIFNNFGCWLKPTTEIAK